MSSNSEDYQEDSFLSELETRFGGKITYRTFAAFYGDSNGIVRDHGVLLYIIDDTFRFQDFAIENNIFGIPIGKKKEYTKFESSFRAEDVLSMRTVGRKAAEDFCLGFREHAKLKTATAITKVFRETVLEIALKDQTFMYFRFMDHAIEKMITQAQDKACDIRS